MYMDDTVYEALEDHTRALELTKYFNYSIKLYKKNGHFPRVQVNDGDTTIVDSSSIREVRQFLEGMFFLEGDQYKESK